MKKFVYLFFSLILGLVLISGSQTSAFANKDEVKLKVFVHYPNPHGKPILTSTCTPTTNDQINDFSLAGWAMPVSGMNYKINYNTKPKNLTSSEIQGAISNSFAAWHAADSKQIFTDAGATTTNQVKRDGTNAIFWKKAGGNALAITYIWYSGTGQLLETDTIFNSRYQWSYTPYAGNDCGGKTGTYDLQSIGTHEFGHWVGLDDLYSLVDKDLTMYGYGDTTELKADTLGLGDITGANTVAP